MTTTDFDYDEWSRLTKDQKCKRLLAEAETDEDRAWSKRLPRQRGARRRCVRMLLRGPQLAGSVMQVRRRRAISLCKQSRSALH